MYRPEECVIRLHEKYVCLEASINKITDRETYIQEQYKNFSDLLEETKKTAEEYRAAKDNQSEQNRVKLQEYCRQIEEYESEPEGLRQKEIAELEEACKQIIADETANVELKKISEETLNELEKTLQHMVNQLSEVLIMHEKTKELTQKSNDLELTANQLIARREIMKNELKKVKKAKHRKH